MKSLDRIKNQLRDGDYELVGTGLGESPNTIKAKVHGYRRDIGGVVEKAFKILFKTRDLSEAQVLDQLKQLRKEQEVES